MAQEVELKLEVTRNGLEALDASGLLRKFPRSTGLLSVYFDTEDRLLWRNDLSLRVRRSRKGNVQTVKQPATGSGLFDRREWEMTVPGMVPLRDERTPVWPLLESGGAGLVPVFTIAVRRRAGKLAKGLARVDVAVDRGEAAAGGRIEPFCEIELEHLSGPKDALFALARVIDGIAPARIGVLSKAERGYRLLGAMPGGCKAEPARIDPAMTVPDAFAAIAGACLRQYRLNEDLLLAGHRPEAVHQARVALRRLRSAMVLFRPVLAGPETGRITDRIRKLAAALGDVRDFDVLGRRAGSGLVAARLTQARDDAWSSLDHVLAGPQARLLMIDIAEWIALGQWRRSADTDAVRQAPLTDFAADGLDRLRRKVRRHGKHLADLTEEQLHQLRKDAKKLRYAIDFTGALFTDAEQQKRRSKVLKSLAELQDMLGQLNDLAVAEERLAALALVGTLEGESFLAGWNRDKLLAKAGSSRRGLLDLRPFWR